MDENNLINYWNQQRAIRVKSQLAPTILLSAVLALAATGAITSQSDQYLKLFLVGLVASGGVFSVTAMVAAVRDGLAVIDSLKALKSLTPLAQSIIKTGSQLKALAVAFMAMSTFNFVALLLYLYS
ncbi:MAG: hypothetical protein EBU65_04900 [Actinobacteria bacterium]|nr:hypothetical protein [Actinomycetota bacterium]